MSEESRGGGLLREVVLITVVALVLSTLVRTFLAQPFYVPSESMEPTLSPDDRILAFKPGSSSPHRGDVVVFRDPGGWLPDVTEPAGPSAWLRNALMFVGLLPSDTGHDLVKRVIGLPGDHVACCDARGRIELNGVGLDEPYIAPGGTDQIRFDVTVPPGSMFVLGDNRGHSGDSRFHLDQNQGGVPLGNAVGRVVAVVWPASHWATVTRPATFDDVPAPTASP